MKWCIIVSEAPYLMEFLGKTVHALMAQGDECVLVYTSKYAEYAKARHFPAGLQSVSKVDWLLKQYNSSRRDYGVLSWSVLYGNFDRVERWPLNYEQSRRRVEQDYQFFEWLFRQEQPDAVLYEPPAGVMGEISFLLASRFGIPYCGVTSSRIPGRMSVHDSAYTNSRHKEVFREISIAQITEQERKFAERFIADFLAHRQLPSYENVIKVRFGLLQYGSHYARRVREVGGPLFRYLRERKTYRGVDFESEHRLRNALRNPFRVAGSQARMVLQKGMYRRMNSADEFYLFPLHVQPEASTSVQARYYSDQAETIRQVAFALPFPCKLYVKEHANAVGSKPGSFYEKIRNVPNVVLIDPAESTPELVRRSKGVITLTGTVGLEAVFAGKPVYALGKVFYEYHPLCRTPKDIEELHEYIVVDHMRGVELEGLDEIHIRFVVSYVRNTFEGIISAASVGQDTNNYQAIARELREVVRMKQISAV